MEEKKLPKIWKIANITPIHKKGHKYEVSNYRSISLDISVSLIIFSIVLQMIEVSFAKLWRKL